MTARVLGVDASLKATGIALPDGTTRVLTTREKGYLRNADLSRQVVTIAVKEHVELVAIEGYAPNSLGILSTIRAAELGGMIRTHLELRSVPWAEVAPSMLKKWATGNGAATKDEMLDAAIARGLAGDSTHDEADAYLARHYGIAHLLG